MSKLSQAKIPVKYIISSGRKSTGASFNMFSVQKGNTVHVAAPKKVFAKAVQRNRAKRLIRAAIINAKIPIDNSFVFFAKKSILTAEFSDIVDEMRKLAADLDK